MTIEHQSKPGCDTVQFTLTHNTDDHGIVQCSCVGVQRNILGCSHTVQALVLETLVMQTLYKIVVNLSIESTARDANSPLAGHHVRGVSAT